MDNYRVTVGIEPTNDYGKAKQDVMRQKAASSTATKACRGNFWHGKCCRPTNDLQSSYVMAVLAVLTCRNYEHLRTSGITCY